MAWSPAASSKAGFTPPLAEGKKWRESAVFPSVLAAVDAVARGQSSRTKDSAALLSKNDPKYLCPGPGQPGRWVAGLGSARSFRPAPSLGGSRLPSPRDPQARLSQLCGLGAPSEASQTATSGSGPLLRRLAAQAKAGSKESWRAGRSGWPAWRRRWVWREETLTGIDGGLVSAALILSIVFGEGAFAGLFFSINWRRTTSIVSQGQSVSVKRGTVTPSGRQRFRFNAIRPAGGQAREGERAGRGLQPGAHVPAVRRRRRHGRL